MSKNKSKNKKRSDSAVRELSLLLAGFSYIWDRIEKLSDDDKAGRDAILAKSIAVKMATVIKRFSIPTQKKALELSNECMRLASIKYIEKYSPPPERIDGHGGLNVNVFSLGLGLLGMHHEHKNKVIHIGMLNELVEMQDYCEKNIDKEEVNIAYKYSDIVYNYAIGLEIK